MKYKKVAALFLSLLIACSLCVSSAAKTVEHVVQKGESMWLIAKKYQVGLSEIINANKQVKNPDLIYPKQILNIPLVDSTVTSYEQQVVDLVNAKRKAAGLGTLKLNWELSRVARIKAQDMKDKNYFDHTSPTYGSPFNMIRNFNISFQTAGENIARGQKTPQAVVDAWWNSEGHRKNMMNSSFTQIGVGYVASGNYWVQMFIG